MATDWATARVSCTFISKLCVPTSSHSDKGEIGNTGKDFGNRALPGEIGGQKWHDLNEDGIGDAGESVLKVLTIYLDTNNSGTLDGGEVSTTTIADGRYVFANLEPLTDYIVREVPQTGWEQIAPDTGRFDIHLDPGAVVRDIDFGNGLTLSIGDVTLNHEGDAGIFIDGCDVYSHVILDQHRRHDV